MTRATVVLVAALLAVGLAGCSGTDSEAAPTATSTSSTTASPGDHFERFTGSVDDFYRVPKPLPAGEPGGLIRVQDIAAPTGGTGTSRSVRIMYHSRDELDRDRAVTGVLTYPSGPAPDDGWPIIATAHGTTGIAASCAPSRSTSSAPTVGLEGVAVATDYIGLGPVGELHPYLSGVDEGRSVLDAVRAARNLPGAHARADFVIWGHSQGGHAALWAHQLAAGYAPELHLKGTVAVAPAAELTKTYGPLDEIVANVVSLMALYGAADEHPEIVPADYVGPEVARQAQVVTTACLGEITSTFVPIAADRFYTSRPQETEPARSLILASDPGHEAADAPLLLLQGDQDIRVALPRTEDLYARLCRVGQVTEYHVFEGTDHDTVVGAGMAMSNGWLADRLGGKAAKDSCDRAG